MLTRRVKQAQLSLRLALGGLSSNKKKFGEFIRWNFDSFWKDSWLGIVSLMAFWMVCTCPEGAMFEILLKISRTCSCCWSQSGLWTFLTWAGVLDDIWGSLHMPWLKFGWNLFSLKASRTVSKMDDITGVVAGLYADYGHSWLGLVSLVTFWMVSICSKEAMFAIWLKSV